MNAGHVDAVVYEGLVYCVDCLPAGIDLDADEVMPILPDEKWDAPAECEACGKEHDYMNLG